MKINVITIICFLILASFFVVLASADVGVDPSFNQTKAAYDVAKNEWLTARDNLLANRTPENLNMAKEKARTFVLRTDEVMVEYLKSVKAKVAESAISSEKKEKINTEVDSRIDFLKSKQSGITGAKSAGELAAIAKELKNEWVGIKAGTKTVSELLIASKTGVLPAIINTSYARAISQNETVAQDFYGNTLEVSKGNLTISGAGKLLKLIMPVKLALGQKLKAFEDKVAGVIFRNNTILMRLKNASIVADTENATGTGSNTEALVKRLRLISDEIKGNLSGEDSKVGDVKVKLAGDMADLPTNASLGVKIRKFISSVIQQRFVSLAKAKGMKIKDTAYSVEVDKGELGNVSNATITMKVGREWIESHGGVQNIKIFRDDENGTQEMLPTNYVGEENGMMVFEGISANGFSVFSLAAIESESAPTQTQTPKQPAFGVLFAVSALISLAFVIKCYRIF
jgi:hypothetical protein